MSTRNLTVGNFYGQFPPNISNEDVEEVIAYLQNAEAGLKKRTSMTLPIQVFRLLEAIALYEGVSHSEVAREAITLYGFLKREIIEKGGKLRLEYPDGNVEQLLIVDDSDPSFPST